MIDAASFALPFTGRASRAVVRDSVVSPSRCGGVDRSSYSESPWGEVVASGGLVVKLVCDRGGGICL